MPYTTPLPHMVISSPWMLFLASVAFTVASYLWVQKLLDGVRTSIWFPLAAGAVNGAIAVAVEYLVQGPMPAVMMAAVPLVLILELRLISRDRLWTYLFLSGAFLLNFGVLHDLSVAAMGIVHLGEAWPRSSLPYRCAIFTLSLIAASVLLLLLFRFMPSRELYTLIHTPTKSLLLLIYMLLSSVVLLMASSITAPLLFQDSLEEGIMVPVLLDLILKDLLLLLCSYIITLIQCHAEHSAQQVTSMTQELLYEREYRSSIQNQSVLSYCVNITQDRVVEGVEHFGPSLLSGTEDSYYRILQNFARYCVYPYDRKAILEHSALPARQRQASTGEGMVAIRFRVSFSAFQRVTRGAVLSKQDSPQMPRWLWLEARDTVIIDPVTGDLIAYVSLFDVHQQVEEEAKLVCAASYDPLTSLCNRATMEERIGRLLADGATGAMLLIDVDNFKLVNDNFGHMTGDYFLQKLADTLRALFRAEDVLCRLGGDEFCVFAVGLTDEAILCQRTQTLIDAVRTLYEPVGAPSFEVSVSVGIARFPQDGTNYHTLYHRSDSALYQAKRAGKGVCHFYQAGDGSGAHAPG